MAFLNFVKRALFYIFNWISWALTAIWGLLVFSTTLTVIVLIAIHDERVLELLFSYIFIDIITAVPTVLLYLIARFLWAWIDDGKEKPKWVSIINRKDKDQLWTSKMDFWLTRILQFGSNPNLPKAWWNYFVPLTEEQDKPVKTESETEGVATTNVTTQTKAQKQQPVVKVVMHKDPKKVREQKALQEQKVSQQAQTTSSALSTKSSAAPTTPAGTATGSSHVSMSSNSMPANNVSTNSVSTNSVPERDATQPTGALSKRKIELSPDEQFEQARNLIISAAQRTKKVNKIKKEKSSCENIQSNKSEEESARELIELDIEVLEMIEALDIAADNLKPYKDEMETFEGQSALYEMVRKVFGFQKNDENVADSNQLYQLLCGQIKELDGKNASMEMKQADRWDLLGAYKAIKYFEKKTLKYDFAMFERVEIMLQQELLFCMQLIDEESKMCRSDDKTG